MPEEEVLLTREGYDKINEEYEQLISVTRKEIAERIKEARDFGDISENAEYDAAKNEQAEIEERIQKLEALIRNATIIDDTSDRKGIVDVGDTVVLRQVGQKKEIKYQIVGSTEADPFEGKISNESVVGAALLGKKVGDKVEVEVPTGKKKYEIIQLLYLSAE